MRTLLIFGIISLNLMGCAGGGFEMDLFSSQQSSLGSGGGNGDNADVNEVKVQIILKNNCVVCHDSRNLSQTGLTFADNTRQLAASSYIVAGSPENSLFYQRIANGTMPPGAPMSEADMQAVAEWITTLKH